MRENARESRTEEANRAGELADGATGRGRRSFLRAAAAGASGVGLAAAATDDAAATVVPPISTVGRDGTQLLRATRTTKTAAARTARRGWTSRRPRAPAAATPSAGSRTENGPSTRPSSTAARTT